LDKPTWLLLPYASEWRWLLGVETTAWYPSMRIFRQSRRGGWPELVDRVSGELRKMGARPYMDSMNLRTS